MQSKMRRSKKNGDQVMPEPDRIAPLIAIVDDQREVRTTVGRGLEQFGYRVHPFMGGEDLLEALEYLRPDCILLDLQMPGLDGLATMDRIPPQCRHIPVIFCTSHGNVPLAVEAMKNGAADFIVKPSTFEIVVSKIEAALLSSRPSIEKHHSADQARALLAVLTKREDEVMRLACEGLRNKEIAERLNIGARTVEFHRHQALHKLGETNLVIVARIYDIAARM